MIENCDGHLLERNCLGTSSGRKRKMAQCLKRSRISKKTLKRVSKVVSVGAPIELRSSPKKARRIYITDTEVNHLAQFSYSYPKLFNAFYRFIGRPIDEKESNSIA